jgi:hypothetical protein
LLFGAFAGKQGTCLKKEHQETQDQESKEQRFHSGGIWSLLSACKQLIMKIVFAPGD